jgi:hypothetical protein
MDGMRSWSTSDEERPWVRLEFEEETSTACRRLAREGVPRQQGSVRLEADGETITDPTRADECSPTSPASRARRSFRSTASVRHHELDGLARDEAALRDRLQASISGGDRGTSRARRKLERAIQMLNAKGDKNPGQIKAARRISPPRRPPSATASRARAAGAGSRHPRRSPRRPAAAEAELNEQRSMLEKARLAERLVSEREQAKERFERYSNAVDVSTQIDELEASHPSSNGLPALARR